MKNRFFTILIIPEKTSQVKRLVIPGWVARTGIGMALIILVFTGIMVFDYWYVMNQIAEYHELRTENRRLQTQVQSFKSKLAGIENTIERVKTFSTQLKVITNIQSPSALLQSLNSEKLPDAATNIALANPSARTLNDPDLVQSEERVTRIQNDSLYLEQVLQDQYELLVDKKAFLAALPTRKPATGYYTSGFGIRRPPHGGGRDKMHEGLDIANQVGTAIYAPAEGEVVFSDVKPGYGKTIIINHGYGLETWYAHNSRVLVRRGQKVSRGEMISQIGNTGRSTGPHLHYEVRFHGTPVDPLTYILEN